MASQPRGVTRSAKTGEVPERWILVDAKDVVLGRLASRIALRLRGKHHALYTPHADTGDFIIVVNAEKVKLTGNKLDAKRYYFNSGFPGGMKSATARNMLAKKPEEVIKIAVKRMLPRSPLGRATFSKLKVYAGAEHPHAAQQPKPHTLPL